MAYVTLTDLDAQMSEREQIAATDDSKLGVRNLTTLETLRVESESEFESYAGRRAALPITPVTGVMRRHIVSAWVYRIASRRSATEQERKNYEDALRWYRDVANGLVVLGDPAPAGNSTSSAGEVLSGDSDWSREKLESF